MFQLDEFFRVTNEVKLPATKGRPAGETVIVRVLSDIEIQSRSEYALTEQVKMSEALRNPESEIYKLKIVPLENADDEMLIQTLADVHRVDLMRDSGEMYRLDFYPYPDKATPEEKVETLRRQDEHEKTVYSSRLQYVAAGEKAYREKLAGLSRDSLLTNAKFAASQVYILKAQVDAELWYTVHAAYSTLNGEPRWTVEQVMKLPGRMLNFLMRKYREVDSVDPWELTKSVSEGDAGELVSSDQERGDDQPAPGA